MRLRTLDGLPTMVPLSLPIYPRCRTGGEPLLLGPGSIHVAHTRRVRGEGRS